MARPFLIALVTLLAVAWPVAAQGDPLAGLPEPNLTDPMSPGATISTAVCRPVHIQSATNQGPLPEYDARFDPDGCIRKFINDIWPLEEPLFRLTDQTDRLELQLTW